MQVICQQCGKEFHGHPSSKRKYCSLDCAYKHRTHEVVQRNCAICQKVFIVDAHQIKRRSARFCSLQCYGLFRREKRDDWTLRCRKHRCKEPHFQEGYCEKHYERQLILEHNHPAPEYAMQWRFSKKTYYLEGKSQYKEGKSEYLRELRLRWKIDVLAYYSKGKPCCSVCHFDDIRGLVLDHIENDGADHRARISKTGSRRAQIGSGIYRWVKEHGYPDGFQVLCANCNMIKEYEYRQGFPGRNIPKNRLKKE